LGGHARMSHDARRRDGCESAGREFRFARRQSHRQRGVKGVARQGDVAPMHGLGPPQVLQILGHQESALEAHFYDHLFHATCQDFARLVDGVEARQIIQGRPGHKRQFGLAWCEVVNQAQEIIGEFLSRGGIENDQGAGLLGDTGRCLHGGQGQVQLEQHHARRGQQRTRGLQLVGRKSAVGPRDTYMQGLARIIDDRGREAGAMMRQATDLRYVDSRGGEKFFEPGRKGILADASDQGSAAAKFGSGAGLESAFAPIENGEV
jgi:hypothetical protein